MEASRFISKFLILFSFPFILALQLHCDRYDPATDQNLLAVVGGKKIFKEDFIKRYTDFTLRTGAPDNGETRRGILRNYIDEKVFILEARKRGYDKDAEGVYEQERLKIQSLLNAYHREFISEKVEVTEEELYQLFLRLNTKLEARHLYAPTFAEADSLYRELKKGRTFDELAKNVFKDSVLRNSGGKLGSFTVDEMEPAFEQAAFGLAVGEISKPVKTKNGYSIIRVDNRTVKPLLTEYEFARHRSKLFTYWKTRKTRQATESFVDSLRTTLNITFNEPIIQKFFVALNEAQREDLAISQEIPGKSIAEIEYEELVRSDLGTWTVAEFQEYAKFTSEKQQNRIHSEERLKEFIAGLVVRSYMLSEAKKQGLHKTPEYKAEVSENFDNYLLDRIEKTLYGEFDIPEDSLSAYYNEDPQRFASPPQTRLREIVLSSEKDASRISARLEKGDSFPELAKKYSVRQWSAEKGGDLGYLTPVDLGKWSGMAFSIDTGKWSGPVEIDSFYVFLECIDKIPARLHSYEEARVEVENAVRAMRWSDVRSEKISEIKKNIDVKSFPEKLRTVKLN